MAVGYHNIFPLEHSEDYVCVMRKYQVSHSALFIEVSRPGEQPFCLYFAMTRYFAGPPHWTGADFRLVEKPEDHLRTLETIEYFNNWPKDVLLERFINIYSVENTIKIVAAEVERLEKSPFAD